MNNFRLISAALRCLRIPYTRKFVNSLCISNPSGDSLSGITRLLETFGVQSKTARIDDLAELRFVSVPFIIRLHGCGFVLVTNINYGRVTFFDKRVFRHADLNRFTENTDCVVVMLHKNGLSKEPGYEQHRKRHLLNIVLSILPLLLVLFLLIRQRAVLPDYNVTVPMKYRLCMLIMAVLGLFASIFSHRQWTGLGIVGEVICAKFKKSWCATVHRVPKLGKWLDLSELGLSFFSVVIFYLLFKPAESGMIAWLTLLAFPVTLWSLWHQAFRLKSWCPLCVIVVFAVWMTALMCLLLGLYSAFNFNMADFAEVILLFCSVLALVVLLVTPAYMDRHELEVSESRFAKFRFDSNIVRSTVGEFNNNEHHLVVAVSPSSPACTAVLNEINTILIPTGRFTMEKVYAEMRVGDRGIIERKFGKEEAEKQIKWCNEHNVSSTPSIFIDGREYYHTYTIKDMLYL